MSKPTSPRLVAAETPANPQGASDNDRGGQERTRAGGAGKRAESSGASETPLKAGAAGLPKSLQNKGTKSPKRKARRRAKARAANAANLAKQNGNGGSGQKQASRETVKKVEKKPSSDSSKKTTSSTTSSKTTASRTTTSKPEAKPEAKYAVPPHAPPAEMRGRHWAIIFSFLLFVGGPIGASAWYLYERADDQYASTLGFSVRKEEAPSASDVIGGLAGLTGASSSDTDVLYEFIQSQELVEQIDGTLDLRAIYTKPEDDPYFALTDNASIEDLVSYWGDMVTIVYDGASGLIEVRVLAFDPNDAQNIAQAIFDRSSAMINSLTAIARADATRYASEELDVAVDRLKTARTSLTEFRSRTQIVDPQADIAGQMGLLNTLQAQLASALIELDLLRDNTRENDPRIRQAEQKIDVIERRIAEERKKFGIGESGEGDPAYAQLIGDYESLVVDREFAEKTYLSALANYDASVAEASRQSRYLAAHINPTLAQKPEYPKRETILALVALFSFVAWGTIVLLFYSIRDRR